MREMRGLVHRLDRGRGGAQESSRVPSHSGMSRPLHELIEANLRRVAHAKGLSLAAIARTNGISLERLLAIFSGEFDPDLQFVGRLAESVGLTAADLLAEHDLN